jgi:hypothetical protein
VEPRYHIKIIKNKYHQSCAGKRYWPHMWVRRLSRGGPGATVGILQTGYPCAKDLKDLPHGSRPAPGARELWLCHVPRGIEHATCQERALVSPRAPWHRARHPPGRGFGVATCPEAPSAPPVRKGLRCHHMARGTEPRGSWPTPCEGRLRRHHVTETPGPPFGRTPVSPRVM